MSAKGWLVGGGLAAGALAFFGRKQIAQGVSVVYDAVKREAFLRLLPDYAQAYGPVILQVAQEQNESPFTIFALGDRETRWGTAPGYTPRGDPGGTGDGGHGRGPMQIDDRSNQEWLAAHDWTDPYTNITKGVQILQSKRAFFQGRAAVHGTLADGSSFTLTDGSTVHIGPRSAAKRGIQAGDYPDPRPLAGPLLDQAAIASYNTGQGNVLMSVAAGLSPDATTAAGPSGEPDYSSDVLARAGNLEAQVNAA